MFECSITAEDIDLFTMFTLVDTQTNSYWHKCCAAVRHELAFHFWVSNLMGGRVASSCYRWDGAGLLSFSQWDAESDPSEKVWESSLLTGVTIPGFVQSMQGKHYTALRRDRNMYSQAHFTVDKTLSRMSATIGSGWWITLGSERRASSRSSLGTARPFDCQQTSGPFE